MRNFPIAGKNLFDLVPEKLVTSHRDPFEGTPGHYGITGVEGAPRPGSPLNQQQIEDAVGALTREFQHEIALLGGRIAVLEPTVSQPDRNRQPYLWLNLSYGEKVDKKWLEQIKQVVARFSSEKSKPAK
jgi:hypothetical protein